MVNYSTNVFTKEYIHNDVKYCFTVYPDYWSEEGSLDDTGSCKVMAITDRGTVSHTFIKENEQWKPDEATTDFDENYLRFISDSINTAAHTHGSA